MAFGKGTWTNQNKKLPGAYVNFVGQAQPVGTAGVRGVAAMGMSLDWGNDEDFIYLTMDTFMRDSVKLLGYAVSDPKLQPVYEVFLGGASELYLYRLNGNEARKATSDIGEAKYKGVRGNKLSVVIASNVEPESTFNVTTYLDGKVVDKQIGVTALTLKDNDFIKFNDGLELTDKTVQFGSGTNAAQVGNADHVAFLTAVAPYDINAIGLVEPVTKDGNVTNLYANWAIKQRDSEAKAIQAVLYNSPSDHEAVINVDESALLVPWVLGAEVGCPLNGTVQNKTYNGSYKITKRYSQGELAASIDAGKFVFHQIGDSFRVLMDINSLVNIKQSQTDEFKYNQVIRVIDQINIDVCNVFNDRYIGKVANNKVGRMSFKNQVVSILNDLVESNTIEDYDTDAVICVEGKQRGSLVLTIPVKLVTMLEKAYITIMVG